MRAALNAAPAQDEASNKDEREEAAKWFEEGAPVVRRRVAEIPGFEHGQGVLLKAERYYRLAALALRQHGGMVTEEMLEALESTMDADLHRGTNEDGFDTVECAACDAVLVIDGKINASHSSWCRVGHLDDLLAALAVGRE